MLRHRQDGSCCASTWPALAPSTGRCRVIHEPFTFVPPPLPQRSVKAPSLCCAAKDAPAVQSVRTEPAVDQSALACGAAQKEAEEKKPSKPSQSAEQGGRTNCWCRPPCTAPSVVHLEVLHLYSGDGDPSPDASTLARIIERLSAERGRAARIRVIEYDILNCGCSGASDDACTIPSDSRGRHANYHCSNLLRDEVFDALIEDCRAGRFAAIIAGIPCDGYCKARFLAEDGLGGPRPLRRREWPTGTPWRLDRLGDREALARSNALTVRGLSLCAAVFETGGEALIENPPDYGTFGLWATNPRTGEPCAWRRRTLLEPRHCPLWLTPWAIMFVRCVADSRFYDFAQCTLGSCYEKYTRLLATPGFPQLAPSPMATFDGRRCTCESAHARQAIGKDAAAAATYPRQMNVMIARAVLQIIEKRIEGGRRGDASTCVNLRQRREAMQPLWLLLDSKQTQEAITVQEQGARWMHAGEERVQPTIAASLAVAARSAAGTRGPNPAMATERRVPKRTLDLEDHINLE